MTSIYSGDPKLFLDGNGADLVFKGGQPVMDRGLSNAVLISLFSNNWFANAVIENPNQRLESKVEEMCNEPITVKGLNGVREAVLKSLQWMIDEKIVSEIDARVLNTNGSQIKIVVVIKPPAGDVQAIVATKHGINWQYQIQEIA